MVRPATSQQVREIRNLAALIGPAAVAEAEIDLPTMTADVARFYIHELVRLRGAAKG